MFVINTVTNINCTYCDQYPCHDHGSIYAALLLAIVDIVIFSVVAADMRRERERERHTHNPKP